MNEPAPLLTIAAAQIECCPGDVERNMALHREAIEAARQHDVDLLVFPELSLTDYQSDPDVAALALPADSPGLRHLSDLAGNMAISVGFVEQGGDGRFYNAQALLSGGHCLHVHRKANLPSYGQLRETFYYAPGRSTAPVRLAQGWRVATLICADMWNPALPWLAALQDIDLLIVPVASSIDAVDGDFDNPAGWDLALRYTAMTYGVPIVMTNHAGSRGGLSFWGGSRVLDAFGREQARVGTESGLAIARVRREDTVSARQRLPTVRDADPGLIQVELERILAQRTGGPVTRP